MRRPTIHMNGTSCPTLLEQMEEQGHAIRAALRALAAGAPNCRDYYPQGPAACPEAIREHDARRQRMQSVLAEIMELHEHVSEHC